MHRVTVMNRATVMQRVTVMNRVTVMQRVTVGLAEIGSDNNHALCTYSLFWCHKRVYYYNRVTVMNRVTVIKSYSHKWSYSLVHITLLDLCFLSGVPQFSASIGQCSAQWFSSYCSSCSFRYLDRYGPSLSLRQRHLHHIRI